MRRSSRILAALAAIALAAAPARASLIHEWSFSEGSGASTADAVGGNTGTLVNAPTWSMDVPLAVGLTVGTPHSLAFNGTDQGVSLTSAFTMSSASDFSVALWYRGTDARSGVSLAPNPGVTSGRGLVDWTGSIYADLVLDGGKATYIRAFPGSTWNNNVQSTTSVADGYWHHIVLVNHSNQTADLFIDGAEQVAGADSRSNGTEYTIDRFMEGYGATFTSGRIADVRIYDSSITLTDIQALEVPEPGSALLLCIGALASAHRRRRFTHR